MHVRLEGMDLSNINNDKFNSMFDEGGNSGCDAHWVFKRHFCSCSEDSHLIETVSSDAGFEQKYYLKVVLREDDDKNVVLVKIDGNSSVYLTPSVRCAVMDLAERIKS